MVSKGIGYICSLVAVLFFGSNYVPVKRFETYDGMFYQWVMCSAIWIWGLLLQLVLLSSEEVFNVSVNGTVNDFNQTALVNSERPDAYSVKFFPFAALGGALWSTGNIMSVPVINSIGLSMGLLIWGASNMLMGWATGAFGLFGVDKSPLAHPELNYAGVALAVVALAIYSQIKTSLAKSSDTSNVEPLRADDAGKLVEDGRADEIMSTTISPETFLDLSPPGDGPSATMKRLGGIAMAIAAGLLFGNNFTPPTYMQDNNEGPDGKSVISVLSYVFSHFTGIFAMSTFWFLLYCAAMKSNPRINPRLVIPGFISGIMWAVASTCWFVANRSLDMSIAFPIITSGPGIVSALWGVFVFGEIKGKRNYVMLSGSILLSITGCVLIALSSSS
ncbi:hypothetical protein AB1Y20_000420 [Prymnesium parvum]|uniref:Transmembrane protein 144 n=1 Tax=Prymnesium parvum TaxID=97485 RepID=A0AB34K4N6_PRYPA